MATTNVQQLEQLVVKLVADDTGVKQTVDAFENGVIRATSHAQGAADSYSRQMLRAAEVTRAAASPMEKFMMDVEELDDLMRLGAITQATYNRTFDKLKGELDEAVPKVNRLAAAFKNMESMASLGYKMSFAITTPLTILGGIALKTASDAEESLNKFNVIFGPVADQANAAVKDLDKNFGLTGTSARQMMAGTGDLLKGFGFGSAAALDLSVQVQKLSVDVASFSNVEGGATRVSEALTKAMLGEREQLKEMGIAILEEDVKIKMAEQAKEGLTFASERQAKAYATLAIAMQQSAHRLGDFQATESSFANQSRMLYDDLWELTQLFGKEMIPVANELVQSVLRPAIEYMGSLDSSTKKIIVVFLGLAAAAGPVIVTIAQIGMAGNALVALWPAIAAGAASFNLVTTATVGMKLGLLAVGTYMANEGLKEIMGYNKEVERLAQNVASLQDTETRSVALADKRAQAAHDKAVEKGQTPKEKAANLRELMKEEERAVRDYEISVRSMQKQLDNSNGIGPNQSSGGELPSAIKMAMDRAATARDRLAAYREEVNALEGKGPKKKIDNTTLSDAVDSAAGGASSAMAWADRLVRGGVNQQDQQLAGQAADYALDLFGDAMGQRVHKKTKDWWRNMWDGPGQQLGVIAKTVTDLSNLVGRDWIIKFKSEGLQNIEADSVEFFAKMAKQQALANLDGKIANTTGGMTTMMTGGMIAGGLGSIAGVMAMEAQGGAAEVAPPEAEAPRAVAATAGMTQEQRIAFNAEQAAKAAAGKAAREEARQALRLQRSEDMEQRAAARASGNPSGVAGADAAGAGNTQAAAGQSERDERDKRKEAALQRIANMPMTITLQVAGRV